MSAEDAPTPRGPASGLDRELEALLRDPAVRRPLKAVILDWRDRDPVDASADAQVFAEVLARRVDALLAQATASHGGTGG